jgi:hypothetical protein
MLSRLLSTAEGVSIESSDKGDWDFVPGRELELSEALATAYSELVVLALLGLPIVGLSRMSYFLANCEALEAARWPRGL